MKRVITLGAYGLMSPRANLVKCTDDLADSKFTGAYVFLLNRWVQPPNPAETITPWVFENGRYNLNKLNPLYRQRFAKLCDLFGSKKLDLFVKFVNPYHLRSWNKFSAMKCKVDPFFLNNLGIDYGSNLRAVYDSISFGPLQWYWDKWEIISEPKVQFKHIPQGLIGKAMFAWIDGVVAEVKKAKAKYPGWRFGWAWANEIDAGGPGDRSELYQLVYDKFKAVGLTPNGTTFFSAHNIQADPDQPDYVPVMKEIHTSLTRKFGDHFGLSALHECHIDGTEDRAKLIGLGFDMNKTFLSTDGIPKDNNFVKNTKALVAKGDPFVDVLYEEGGWGFEPVAPYRWMANWNRAFPHHKQLVDL